MKIYSKKIKLMPDYFCWPLWQIEPKGNNPYALDDSDLPLSKQLIDDIRVWAQRYDAILNQEYPGWSRFKSQDDEIDFIETGWRLRDRVAQELPDVEVLYFDIGWSELLAEKYDGYRVNPTTTNDNLFCRVCGYYRRNDVCSCCGETTANISISLPQAYSMRKQWIKRPYKWHRTNMMPDDWSLEDQLKDIPDDFNDNAAEKLLGSLEGNFLTDVIYSEKELDEIRALKGKTLATFASDAEIDMTCTFDDGTELTFMPDECWVGKGNLDQIRFQAWIKRSYWGPPGYITKSVDGISGKPVDPDKEKINKPVLDIYMLRYVSGCASVDRDDFPGTTETTFPDTTEYENYSFQDLISNYPQDRFGKTEGTISNVMHPSYYESVKTDKEEYISTVDAGFVIIFEDCILNLTPWFQSFSFEPPWLTKKEMWNEILPFHQAIKL